jgi:hypothetical protein
MKPRRVDRPLVLYGWGALGSLAKEIFYEIGIRPAYTMDKTCSFDVLPKDVLVAVCVATEPYSSVIAPLVAAGWKDIVPVWDIIEAYPEIGIHNGWRRKRVSEKEQRIITSFNWDDGISDYHYNTFLAWRLQISGRPDNISYLRRKPCLPSTLKDIRLRQRVATYDDSPMKTVDIHAEGCELETIKKNLYLFQRYRPKIEVACYHSRDGLWKIPSLLMSELDDYGWKFRLHAYMGQGAYIYGTPRGR